MLGTPIHVGIPATAIGLGEGCFRYRYRKRSTLGDSRLRAPVNVVQSHDVVFAQITARLHFDQFKRHFAGVT